MNRVTAKSDFGNIPGKEIKEILEANARLLAKREARARLKAEGKLKCGPPCIPIKAADELIAELLPTLKVWEVSTSDGDNFLLMDFYLHLLEIVRRVRESL